MDKFEIAEIVLLSLQRLSSFEGMDSRDAYVARVRDEVDVFCLAEGMILRLRAAIKDRVDAEVQERLEDFEP